MASIPLEYPLGFKVNPAFEQELKESAEYKRGLWEKAEEAAGHARSFAPVFQGTYPPSHPGEPGDYLASIHVREGDDGPEVASDDYKAFWIEFGTGQKHTARDGEIGEPDPNPPRRPGDPGTPAFAPLRRGVRAAGMDFRSD